MGELHDPDARPLPDTLPIFPLGGALLLPRAKLPLNIFEPRYLNMTEDAMAGDRMIGMIQPRQAFEHPVPNDAVLYDVGCVGRITSFSETDDGRYLLTLTGVCRFVAGRELPMARGYRRMSVSYKRFARDRDDDPGRIADRDRLIAAARTFFDKAGMQADWGSMKAVPDDTLVSALAMVCPLEANEKQALLECADLAARGEFLTNLLEIALRAGDDEASRLRH